MWNPLPRIGSNYYYWKSDITLRRSVLLCFHLWDTCNCNFPNNNPNVIFSMMATTIPECLQCHKHDKFERFHFRRWQKNAFSSHFFSHLFGWRMLSVLQSSRNWKMKLAKQLGIIRNGRKMITFVVTSLTVYSMLSLVFINLHCWAC